MDAVPDGRILGRQAEGVEAHREHHVIALHALVAGARIRRRHRVPMADVQVAARIGQHGQCVMLGPALVDDGAIQLVGFPFRLPLGLQHLRAVGNIADHAGAAACALFSRLLFLAQTASALLRGVSGPSCVEVTSRLDRRASLPWPARLFRRLCRGFLALHRRSSWASTCSSAVFFFVIAILPSSHFTIRQPVMPVGDLPVQDPKEFILQSLGDGPASAAAYLHLIHRAHGRDLDRRAGEEHLIRHIQHLARKALLAHFDAQRRAPASSRTHA